MNNRKTKLLVITVILSIVISITGCASIKDKINTAKGNLVGQAFDISVYDNYASKTLGITGNKVTVGLLKNMSNIDAETKGYKSDVLEITVNGNQMFQVGNTVIFEEKGIDKVEEYLETEIEVKSGGSFVPVDRLVNNIRNKIGKEKTIIISSQLGVPIVVYQGKEVYVTVPKDIPKTTRLNIDGKSLYIHRANYVILDTNILNGG